MSSSHLLLGLPIALLVLYFELSSGFHSAAFTNHLSFGSDAILIASLHFILLWVLLQHRIFAFSIFSRASSVLLFMHSSSSSSSSIIVVSISSSVSFSKETSPSWSVCVFELCPSSLSSPVLPKSSVSSFPSRPFVSRSFCFSFSFVWRVEAFCVASIEIFFRAL